jgi:hypothetical protein
MALAALRPTQRPHQPRPLRDGDGVHVREPHPGAGQRLLDHRQNALHVLSRRQLGHNTPVRAVNRDLARHHVRKDPGPADHHRGRRFVTGTLDPQDQHGPYSAPIGISRRMNFSASATFSLLPM